jgi:hypothetical protein
MARKTVPTTSQDNTSLNLTLDPNDKQPVKTVKAIAKAATKPAAKKPGPKPGAKAAAAKAAVKPVVEKATRNIGEAEVGLKTSLDDLPKGLTDILPDAMLEILDTTKGDAKVVNFGVGTLPNDLGFVRVYAEDKLVTITDPEHLPRGWVTLESNKTLGSKVFYIHTTKLPGHPQEGEYTTALRNAYDVAISEALRDAGYSDFIPAAVATIGVVEEFNPMLVNMESIHSRLRRQRRPDQQYLTRPIGEHYNRNTMSVLTRNGETDYMFVLDNLMEVNTSRAAVNQAIERGHQLVIVTIGERSFTAAVTLESYPISLNTLNQTLLLEYLNDAVRALLVTAWFDKMITDVVVTEFNTKFAYVTTAPAA